MSVLIIKLTASTYIFQILTSYVCMTDTFQLWEEPIMTFILALTNTISYSNVMMTLTFFHGKNLLLLLTFLSFLHTLNGIIRDIFTSLYRCHIVHWGSIYIQFFSLKLSMPMCVHFANISLFYTEYLQLDTYWWPTIKLSSKIAWLFAALTSSSRLNGGSFHMAPYFYTTTSLSIGGTPLSWSLEFGILCMASVSLFWFYIK